MTTTTSEITGDQVARLAREVSQLTRRDRTRMFKLVGSLQRQEPSAKATTQDLLLEIARRGWESLSLREEQVLFLVVEGLTNKEIAARLGISPRTVELHRSRTMHKLCAKNTADLCRIVSALGLSDDGQLRSGID